MRSNLKLGLFIAFCMLTGNLFAVESLGRYEGTRVGAPAGEKPTFFDTCAWTYTEPGKLDLQITFCKDDPSEVKKGGADVFQFALNISRADYEKVFESNAPVADLVLDNHIWNSRISSEIKGQQRIVKIDFTNSLDKEITSVFKRGSLVMVFENGQISSLKMTKEKKRFLNMGGFSTSFVGEVKDMKRVKKGLALFDNGEMGRLTGSENIEKVLATKNTKTFVEVLKLEK